MPSPTSPTGGPRQPWLHTAVVATHAPATVVSSRDGDIGAPGTGLFVSDRRVLSLWRTTVDGEPPAVVAAAAVGDEATFLSAARNVAGARDEPTVQLRRHRTVTADGSIERLRIASRALEPVHVRLTVCLAGDGAEVAKVKAGLAYDPLAAALAAARRADALCWSDERHLTRVSAVPQPSAIRAGRCGEPSEMVFELDLAAGQTRVVTVTVTTRRLARTCFDADSGADAVDWNDASVRSADPAVERLVDLSLRDLRSLVLRDPAEPADVFVAAGSPWYLTLFGRDSLWCARFMLPFGTELAGGTLRALARRAGRDWNSGSQEEPGRIPHEVRREAFVDPTSGLHLPPVYYGSVDATALWLILLAEAWEHGLPEEQVRDLLPAARAAFGWLEQASARHPDGLLAYRDTSGHGLTNQGWKDSDDAMRRADGSVAPAPIALLEVQGYAAQAARRGAAMLAALGEPGAAAWRGFADAMTTRLHDAFWAGSAPHPAMAVDGNGAPVDGLGSNMGHLLGSGTLRPEQAARVVDRLTGPDMLGEFGINTLSRDNPAFNPLGYHTGSVWTHDTVIAALGMGREGFGREARRVVDALVRAAAAFDGRSPELFSGDTVLGSPAPYPAACRPQGWAAAAVGAIVTTLLGLRIDVPARRVVLRPVTSGPLTVRGLRFAGKPFEVVVGGDGPVVTGLRRDVVVDSGP